ncbi:unnamed protein product, partial [Prunus brigantina]
NPVHQQLKELHPKLYSMAIWFFIFLLFTVGESSKPAKQVNEADMRTRSYHGFVILLQFVHSSSIPELLRNTDITFFMPNDQELSAAAVTPHHLQLQEFILSHSIPTALNFGHLLHFPNGSLVPSSTPSKTISVTHSRRSGLFLNNAKIVTPQMSVTALQLGVMALAPLWRLELYVRS